MKKIIIFLAMILMLSSFGAAATVNEAGIDINTENVVIKGKISPDKINGRGLSILLKKKGAQTTDADFVGYVNQIPVNEDGSYSLKFNFTKDIKAYEMLVLNGDTNATDTVNVAEVTKSKLSEAKFNFSEDGTNVILNAELTNELYADEFDCIAVIAGYDEEGKLICADVSESKTFSGDVEETLILTAQIPQAVHTVKGYVWNNLVQMIPLCQSEKKMDEYIAYTWSIPNEETEGVYPMFYLYPERGTRPEDPEKMTCAYLYDGNYTQAAQTMKTFMESRPEEARVVITHMGRLIYNTDEERPNTFDNWFWWDEGIDDVISRLDLFFTEYKRIGGPDIKGMFWDFEAGCDSYNIAWGKIGGDSSTRLDSSGLKAEYDKIIADSRYATDIRPELEKIGFEFADGIEDKLLGRNELYYYYTNKNESYYIGQVFATQRKHSYMNKIYEAVKEHFPNIIFSNYGSYNSVTADVMLEAENSTWYQKIPEETERSASPVGTHSSPVLYGQMPSIDRTIEGYEHGNVFKKTPFNAALAMLQKIQRTTAYSEEQLITPWIMNYTCDYSENSPTPYSSTEYYKELVLQMGLCNTQAFLIFNNEMINRNDWANENELFSALIAELNEVAGFSGRKSLVTEPISGNMRYLLTGMEVNGHNLWRIAPDIYTPDGSGGYVTKESFLADARNLIFRIGNQTVDFPEGSYIYEVKNEQSSVGYWIISPKNTAPAEYIDSNYAAAEQTDYAYEYGAEEAKLKEEMGVE